VRKARDRIIGVIHRKCDAFALEIVHVQRGRLTAALRRIHELKLPGARRDKVGRAVLVAERVATDDDGLDPTGDRTGDALEDDWLAEHGPADEIADGAIGRAPHLLQLEFFHACLVRRDGCAFDPDVVFEDRFGRLDSYSVIGSIAMLKAEIKVFNVKLQVREDELFADLLPYDARHLVPVKFNDRILHDDLLSIRRHAASETSEEASSYEWGKLRSSSREPPTRNCA